MKLETAKMALPEHHRQKVSFRQNFSRYKRCLDTKTQAVSTIYVRSLCVRSSLDVESGTAVYTMSMVPYSLGLENTTLLKHCYCQIFSYKICSFCEQTLLMGANDVSGQGLQSSLKNRHQNTFLRKLQAFSQVLAIFVKITRQFLEISTNLSF